MLTNNFLNKYFLKTNRDYNSSTSDEILNRWNELVNDYNHLKDVNVFISYVVENFHPLNNKEMYNNYYVKTIYWRTIADFVRHTRNKCEFNYKHNPKYLDIHHKTYDILGMEINNLQDLGCLCSKCHNNTHGHINYNGKDKVDAEYDTQQRTELLEFNLMNLTLGVKAEKKQEIIVVPIKSRLDDDNSFDATMIKCKQSALNFNFAAHELRKVMSMCKSA